jgi:arylsulfatase A-like enzyme
VLSAVTLAAAAATTFTVLSPAPPPLSHAPHAIASSPLPSGIARGCILISIDTLRSDHLGCYGYAPPTSPNVDRFRRDAVLFTAAIAQAPSTLASHASMLTSLLPPHHGASYKHGTALAPGIATLAGLLRSPALRTLSFNEGGQIAPEFGLDRGFDRYRSAAVPLGAASFTEQVGHALVWLDRHPGQPFFVFLHSYQVHHPYMPDPRDLASIESAPYRGPLPAGQTPMEVIEAVNDGALRLAPGDLRHIVATYDAQIHGMDAGFGQLIEYLARHGLYDDTAVVFTADHGEEFGEHGRVGWHSHTLYDELLRVPLIKYPHSAHGGETVTRQVRSIDIAPTILALLGRRAPDAFLGSDLTPLVLRREEPARPAVSNLDGGGVPAIRTLRWKLIGRHLFDLATDPGETRDVSGDFPDVAAYLTDRRAALLASAPTASGPPASLTAEAAAQLGSLGYLAKPATRTAPPQPPAAAPLSAPRPAG